jgi:biopolymer transport protein ExbB
MNQLTIIESIVSTLLRGGWVLVPIFLVGWAAWFYLIERWFFLKTQRFSYKLFWQDIEQSTLTEYPSVFKKYGNEEALFAKILKVFSTSSFTNEYTATRDGTHSLLEKTLRNQLQWVESEYTEPLERHLSTISVLGAVAPLLGLLGTVSGMVHTFENITRFGFGNPVLMADGISESLLTTQSGLVVAFPIVLAGNALRNRMIVMQEKAHGNALTVINRVVQLMNSPANLPKSGEEV